MTQGWILNDTPSKRFPLYTRSNAAEVMGDPVSPLTWTYVWSGAFGPGTIRGYVDFGAFSDDEFADSSEVYANFGGYFFLNLSAMCILSERMAPGGAMRLMEMFDGSDDTPSYKLEDWHSDEGCTARLSATIADVFKCRVPGELEALHNLSLEIREQRPVLENESSDALLQRMRALTPAIERAGRIHVMIGQAGLIADGRLQALLGKHGLGGEHAKLCSGIGGVESADIAAQLWNLSRLARQDPNLRAALSNDELSSAMEFDQFGEAFDQFLYEHGARSNNEWDLMSATYETDPQLALALIKSMSEQGDESDPSLQQLRSARQREEAIAAISEQLEKNQEDLAQLLAATEATATWFVAREKSKNMCVRVVHEARMCCELIASRLKADGAIEARNHFYMITDGELDDLIANPAQFRAVLADRYRTYQSLFDLEPPFVVDGYCPPVSQWLKREPQIAPQSDVGEVLTGFACSPGVVEGRARIVLDPSDPSALEPDDILVTSRTNPSWTPLFLVAGAVVTEFGLFNSHASIVSRELGIPCVTSVENLVSRIADGQLLRVDGDAGAIELLEEQATS